MLWTVVIASIIKGMFLGQSLINRFKLVIQPRPSYNLDSRVIGQRKYFVFKDETYWIIAWNEKK